MPDSPKITHPLLRLGRAALGPGLHGLPPGSAESGLVVTATVAAPDAALSRSYAWDVAWADAIREARSSSAPIRLRPRRWNVARGPFRAATPRSWSRRTARRC